ncbi:oxysterol-binding protein-related protein 2 [Lepeophtheirus salmonis]|uniref:Oxysterolbinding proteinrelated protein 2like [Haplochromis burtoni] n=1 Tax=Lepeophtheirus salmonis TaxID=72036 RepID=A0A0K2T010_LEPSM|nr:oxysterol-binding protein-related protein 2-like [Lepeophtheirus salmonis]
MEKSSEELSPSKRENSPPHRKKLPVPQPEKNNANFWYFLKQCIGRELTKITMPVAWNEPLSFLERISEYVNYAFLLKVAHSTEESDIINRLQLVTTFAVSSLASNNERLGKPFNPLLGETYELRNSEVRILCEQVGHHPPVSAFYAEHPDGHFVFQGSINPKVKFWGKSVEFSPKGTLSVHFPAFNETFTWSNVNCIVHNVIVGSLWMEHTGTMEIVNQKTKHRCVLTFKPGSWHSEPNNLHVVEGFLLDPNKNKLRFIYGKWTEFLCTVSIPSFEDFFKVKAEKIDIGATKLPKHCPLNMCEISGSSLLWQADPRPEDSDIFYNFTEFAIRLNEIRANESYLHTDCRHRPDIRALENGLLDLAASEKERLENKQREYRKPYKGKNESDWWTPKWFIPSKNEFTKESDWKYVGGFWEDPKRSIPRSDSLKIPDIF